MTADRSPRQKIIRELLTISRSLVGALLLGGSWYGLTRLTQTAGASETVSLIVEHGGTIAAIAAFLTVATRFVVDFREAWFRRTSDRVRLALADLKSQSPAKSVADISTSDVAAAVTTAGLTKEHVARLIEQGKQDLLIDDQYIQKELSNLIVDYLQPLPRNAKRVLNRFRVSLLIAHTRGLLTSESGITTKQLGKWLVLGERWPQLRTALLPAPEQITELENTSRRTDKQDPFWRTLRPLAPLYIGDEDLRRFMQSEPALGSVLPRLVHYGDS